MDPQLKANILEAFGIQDLPVEQQDEMIGKIGAAVFQTVLARALQGMHEEDQKGLEEALAAAGDDAEAALVAIRTHIPDFQELVQQEVEHMAEESRRIIGS